MGIIIEMVVSTSRPCIVKLIKNENNPADAMSVLKERFHRRARPNLRAIRNELHQINCHMI